MSRKRPPIPRRFDFAWGAKTHASKAMIELQVNSMPEIAVDDAAVPNTPFPTLQRLEQMPVAAGYGLSFLLVAVATTIGFAVWHLIAAPNLTLLYVLPVIIAATAFGWGPSLLAVGLGSIAYDYFFTEPYYSLTMTNPSEIWAVVLLLIIATISASVAATARRRTLQASEAAERAEALQAVAHAVVHGVGEPEVLDVAAVTLHRLFRAPTAIYLRRNGEVTLAASAGGARNTDADREAAAGALSSSVNTRGETYPYDRTYFDFWPILAHAGLDCVLGVDFTHADRERPVAPEQLIEAVGGYLAASLKSSRPDRSIQDFTRALPAR